MRPLRRWTGIWSRSSVLPDKENRSALEDLALPAQHLILALQLARTGALIGTQYVSALAAVGLALAAPGGMRLLRPPELGRQLTSESSLRIASSSAPRAGTRVGRGAGSWYVRSIFGRFGHSRGRMSPA